MRWFIAGLAFAGVVGLAVATASIRVSNVGTRARIQRIDDSIEVYVVSNAAARERYMRATRPSELLRLWQEVEAIFAEMNRS